MENLSQTDIPLTYPSEVIRRNRLRISTNPPTSESYTGIRSRPRADFYKDASARDYVPAYKEATEKKKLGKWNSYFATVRRSLIGWGQRLFMVLCIAAFFAAYSMIFLAFFYVAIDLQNPGHSNMILQTPALNFRPRPADDEWGTFLHYNRGDLKTIKKLVTSVREGMKFYGNNKGRNEEWHGRTRKCNFKTPANLDNIACRIGTKRLGTYCYRNQLFGLNDGKPCIFIRINKVDSWVPESFSSYAELKAAGFPDNWDESRFDPRYFPITCEGRTDVDKELLGPVKYIYPAGRRQNGLPSYLFPYSGQLYYPSPGVMVNFYNLTFSVPIRIVCKVWAKNVRHVPESPYGKLSGAVEFELMIDSGSMNQTERFFN